MLKYNIFIIFAMLLLLTSCQWIYPETEQNITQTKTIELEMRLGFMPHVIPEANNSFTSPKIGLSGFEENQTITINANESKKYEIYKWEIKPVMKDIYEMEKKNFTINLTEKHTITAYFGCDRDDACEYKYMCEEKECVPSNRTMPPIFKMTYGDLGSENDTKILQNITSEIKKKGYINIMNPILFNKLNFEKLNNQITLAIYDENLILITGPNLSPKQIIFLKDLDNVLEELDIQNIRKIKSEQVTTNDMYKLFLN